MLFDTKNIDSMNVENYLLSKGVEIVSRSGAELITKCPFSDCDIDSKGKEGHCYFNKDTGTYHCFKCDTKGNKVTLAKYFNDWGKTTTSTKAKRKTALSGLDKTAYDCHANLSQEARGYLHKRGLSDETIDSANLGQGEFYGKTWITIPIKHGNSTAFLKLRAFPETKNAPKYLKWPKEKTEAELYGGSEILESRTETICVTEGEFDALIARQNNLPFAVSGTAGAGTFKEEWLEYLRHIRTIYLALDNDEKGEEGAEKILNLLKEKRPDITVIYIQYPEGTKDMTEYFAQGLSPANLLENCTIEAGGPPQYDIREMKEMRLEDLEATLDLTIKYEKENKCILFLACLTAYTEEDQLNVYLVGPSSSGKTYLMKEVAAFFPSEDKETLAEASPTAFKHRKPISDPVTGEHYVDLERKILLFQDAPNFQLQKTLRPLMSHDSKFTEYQTTDRGKDTEHIAKKSLIKGFPVIVVCSANEGLDEQEATRALVLSPEVSEEKTNAGVIMANRRASNPDQYEKEINSNPQRQELMERIRFIKNLHINSVIIPFPEETLAKFKSISKTNQPRSQRDIQHFNSLIKASAMLNAPFRLDDNKNVIATKTDLYIAAQLWGKMHESAELGISPYTWGFYKNYILPPFERNSKKAIKRRDIINEFYGKTGERITADKFRKSILPNLESAGVVKDLEIPGNREHLVLPLIDENGDPIKDYGKDTGNDTGILQKEAK